VFSILKNQLQKLEDEESWLKSIIDSTNNAALSVQTEEDQLNCNIQDKQQTARQDHITALMTM
jgi:hypothetical protein